MVCRSIIFYREPGQKDVGEKSGDAPVYCGVYDWNYSDGTADYSAGFFI